MERKGCGTIKAIKNGENNKWSRNRHDNRTDLEYCFGGKGYAQERGKARELQLTDQLLNKVETVIGK